MYNPTCTCLFNGIAPYDQIFYLPSFPHPACCITCQRISPNPIVLRIGDLLCVTCIDLSENKFFQHSIDYINISAHSITSGRNIFEIQAPISLYMQHFMCIAACMHSFSLATPAFLCRSAHEETLNFNLICNLVHLHNANSHEILQLIAPNDSPHAGYSARHINESLMQVYQPPVLKQQLSAKLTSTVGCVAESIPLAPVDPSWIIHCSHRTP